MPKISKTDWGVILASLVGFFYWLVPPPVEYKHAVASLVLLGIFGSIFGWLCDHSKKLKKLRHGPQGKKFLTLMIIFIIGGTIFIGIWFCVPTFEDKTSSTETSQKEPDETTRPIISVRRGQLIPTPGTAYHFNYMVEWRNTGDHPMEKLRDIFIIEGDPSFQMPPRSPAAERIEKDDPITTFCTSIPEIALREPCYVIDLCKYSDAVNGKEFQQTLCFKWHGRVSAQSMGEYGNVLEMITIDEQASLEKKYADLYKTF
jgi:hypothetical protein